MEVTPIRRFSVVDAVQADDQRPRRRQDNIPHRNMKVPQCTKFRTGGFPLYLPRMVPFQDWGIPRWGGGSGRDRYRRTFPALRAEAAVRRSMVPFRNSPFDAPTRNLQRRYRPD